MDFLIWLHQGAVAALLLTIVWTAAHVAGSVRNDAFQAPRPRYR